MLYGSTLLLVDGSNSYQIRDVYTDVLERALYNTMSNGELDVLIMKGPTSIPAIQRLVKSFYDIVRQINHKSIKFRVLLDGNNIDSCRKQHWEVVSTGKYEEDLINEFRDQVPAWSGLPVVILKMDNEPAIPEEEYEYDPDELEYDVVAVGGTFDHLHDGHKLLLTISGYLAKSKLIVGITGSELLQNKKYAEVMEPFMTRRANVEDFLNYLYPALELDIHMLHDVAGPTGSIENIDALVVSGETRKGADQVNEIRKAKGWNELAIYVVDVVGCESGDEGNNWSDKLSSTELRRLEFEKLKI